MVAISHTHSEEASRRTVRTPGHNNKGNQQPHLRPQCCRDEKKNSTIHIRLFRNKQTPHTVRPGLRHVQVRAPHPRWQSSRFLDLRQHRLRLWCGCTFGGVCEGGWTRIYDGHEGIPRGEIGASWVSDLDAQTSLTADGQNRARFRARRLFRESLDCVRPKPARGLAVVRRECRGSLD